MWISVIYFSCELLLVIWGTAAVLPEIVKFWILTALVKGNLNFLHIQFTLHSTETVKE